MVAPKIGPPRRGRRRQISGKRFGVVALVPEHEIKQVMEDLAKLPIKIGRKILRKSVSAGITPMRSAFKKRIPRRTGGMSKSVKRKQKQYSQGKKGATNFGAVGIRNDLLKDNQGRRYRPAWVVHIVDKGSRPHLIMPKNALIVFPGKAGRGQVQALNFARRVNHPGAKATNLNERAFHASKTDSERRFMVKAKAGIDAVAKEIARESPNK